MNWQDAALGLAGVIGSCVAVAHGILTQRLAARPLEALILADKGIADPIKRLLSPLLHFSTFSWFFGGLALIAAANWFDQEARLVTGLFVGASYLYGAIVNLWATRGRHPGWMLLAATCVLIVFGVGGFSG